MAGERCHSMAVVAEFRGSRPPVLSPSGKVLLLDHLLSAGDHIYPRMFLGRMRSGDWYLLTTELLRIDRFYYLVDGPNSGYET